MTRIVFVFIGSVLFTAGAASAQFSRPEGRPYGSAGLQASQTGRETLNLTIEDAVRRATENNPDLAIARLNTQVEVERVSETLAAYAPVFSTVLGRSSNETPPSNFLLGEQGVATRDWFSSTGVRQRLARGAGTWSISWDASRTTSNSPLNSFQPSLQSGFRLALSQPLLKDRKMDSARQQNIIANRDQRSSELRFSEAGVQTVAAVKQAYWTFKATLANVAVQQRSLELAHALVRENKARVDVGQTPPLDLMQAEAEVAQRRENLIRATTAAEDAEDRLRRLIMDPADISFWRVRLNPIDEAIGGAPLPDVDAVIEGALKERYDLARARIELDNVNTNVEFFNNQKLPDVRLETSYSGSGLGGTQLLRSGGFPGSVIGTRNKSFGDALGQAFGSSYPTWSLGVTVSYSLGRSFEEASLARSQVERRQVTQRIASLQLQAAESIRQAARQVHSTLERVDAARAGATLAERRLDTEQRRFDVGLSTSFLVTQAQRDLLQAEVSLLQATLDHQSALVSFEAVQQAPANGDALVARGAPTVLTPTTEPRGLFRQSSGAGF
jgi:outer membrane protein